MSVCRHRFVHPISNGVACPIPLSYGSGPQWTSDGRLGTEADGPHSLAIKQRLALAQLCLADNSRQHA